MIDASTAAALVDDIAGEEHRLHRIGSKFREQADEPQNPVVGAVVWMLGYRFVEASAAPARSRYGVPFAPAIESQEGAFPPYLDEIPDSEDVLAIWTDLAGLVRHPAIKARVSDLLWCIQSGGDRHQHARNAIEAYISAAAAADTGEAHDERLLGAVRGLGRPSNCRWRLTPRSLQDASAIASPTCSSRSCKRRMRVPGQVSGCGCSARSSALIRTSVRPN